MEALNTTQFEGAVKTRQIGIEALACEIYTLYLKTITIPAVQVA